MKQIAKNFNNLIKKTLFKPSNKTNNFFKKIKIVKYFDNFIERIALKINRKIKNYSETKIKKDLKVSNFNKLTITSICLLFLYLFYLLIPTLYDKTWLQNSLENKLVKDFKINFSTSSDITYNILPTPHFLIKNSKIFIGKDNQKTLAEIKKLKVFIYQSNFFDKEKMNIKKLLIDSANFSVQAKDLKLLNKIKNKKYSSKKIRVIRSNIFFKDDNSDIISIIKVPRASFSYIDIKSLNLFSLDGKIFKTPFTMSLKKDFLFSDQQVLDFESKKLKLKINNTILKKSDNLTEGINVISIMNSKLETLYNVRESLVSFRFNNSKIKNSNINYNGKLSLRPFDLILNVELKKYDIAQLFNVNSLFNEFLQTKLFFNENVSASISINTGIHKYNEIFKTSQVKFNVINGKINFNNTKLINEKIGTLELDDSNLFFQDNKLYLNSNAIVEIKDLKNLFSLMQTPRQIRKSLKNILINFDFDFSTNQININNLKINNFESNDEMMGVIADFNNSDEYNLIKSKRIFNKLISAYDG